MTPSEADKIIAEFMGFQWKIERTKWILWKQGTVMHNHPKYSESLDSLGPVWNKLSPSGEVTYNWATTIDCDFHIRIDGNIYSSKNQNTVAEAAAIATAKAILEQRGEG